MAQKIMIAVPSAGYLKHSVFMDYFDLMDKPEGTIISRAHGQSPAKARNVLIESAIKQDCTHVFFLDDDVLVPKDILPKLLARDKDVVTGLYLMRGFPHQGIIFDVARDDGKCRFRSPGNDETDLIPIVNCGLGAVLIKIDVFKKLSQPWVALGQLDPENWCDDIYFFNKVREAGFEIFCDLSVQCGHYTSVAVWPRHADGKWMVDYDTSGSSRVSFVAITVDNNAQP